MANDHALKIKVTADTGEAGQNLDRLTGSQRELMKSARELGSAFPEVANVLRALAGPTGVIVAAIELFREAKSEIEDWTKSLDEQIKANANPMFLEGINAKREALERAAQAATLYADALAHTRTQAEDLARVEKAAAESAKLAQEIRQAAVDAGQSVEMAKLKAMRDADLISEQQFQELKTAAVAKGIKDRAALEEQAKQDEIAAQQTQLHGEQVRQAELNKLIPGAQAAANTSGARAARDDKDLQSALAQREDLKKRIQDAEDHLATVNQLKTLDATVAGPIIEGPIRAEAKARIQQILDETTKNDALIAKLQGRVPGEKTQAALDDKAATRLQEEQTSLAKAIPDLTEQIRQNNEHLAAIRQEGTTKADAATLTGLLETAVGTEAFAANAGADIMAKGGKVSRQVQQLMMNVAMLLEGHNVTLEQAVSLLKNNQDNAGFLQREMRALEAQSHSQRALIGNGN